VPAPRLPQHRGGQGRARRAAGRGVDAVQQVRVRGAGGGRDAEREGQRGRRPGADGERQRPGQGAAVPGSVRPAQHPGVHGGVGTGAGVAGAGRVPGRGTRRVAARGRVARRVRADVGAGHERSNRRRWAHGSRRQPACCAGDDRGMGNADGAVHRRWRAADNVLSSWSITLLC
jgi:hypothetical protein